MCVHGLDLKKDKALEEAKSGVLKSNHQAMDGAMAADFHHRRRATSAPPCGIVKAE